MASFGNYVKNRRGILDHLREGRISLAEFAVFQALLLLADSVTGSGTINAAVLRSCYFPGLGQRGAQRILESLEDKQYIWRENPSSSKHAYRFWMNKYEATTGKNRLSFTDLSKSSFLKTLRTLGGRLLSMKVSQ